MKLIIELGERQFKDIQRITSIQIRRKSLTCEQIIANGTPLEEKTGHWITKVDKWGDVVTTINGYKCSVCGGKRTDETGDWIQIHECKYPYCPDCGAKMEGEQE